MNLNIRAKRVFIGFVSYIQFKHQVHCLSRETIEENALIYVAYLLKLGVT